MKSVNIRRWWAIGLGTVLSYQRGFLYDLHILPQFLYSPDAPDLLHVHQGRTTQLEAKLNMAKC